MGNARSSVTLTGIVVAYVLAAAAAWRRFPDLIAALYAKQPQASYGRSPALPSPFAHAIRNFYLPMVCLLWSLIAITRFDPRRVAIWTAVFVWFAVQIPFIPEPRVMPDQRWEKYAERLKSGDEMTVPITPQGWSMKLREKRD